MLFPSQSFLFPGLASTFLCSLVCCFSLKWIVVALRSLSLFVSAESSLNEDGSRRGLRIIWGNWDTVSGKTCHRRGFQMSFFWRFEHHEAEFDSPPLNLEWQQSFYGWKCQGFAKLNKDCVHGWNTHRGEMQKYST